MAVFKNRSTKKIYDKAGAYSALAELEGFVAKYGGSVKALNRGTGKANVGGDLAHHGYLNVYAELFNALRYKDINFLEIGIFQGRSLAVWSDYFSNGKIYGIDIDLTEFRLMKPELETMGAFKNNNLCNILEGDSIESVVLTFGFDIIIDDGDHSFPGQYGTFKNYFPLLKKGGIYIIEDSERYICQILEQKEFNVEVISKWQQNRYATPSLILIRK